jgi:hypothetical protein
MSRIVRGRTFLCPHCKKPDGVPLLWGMPDEAACIRAANREVILAGCVMGNDAHDLQCRVCAHRWTSQIHRNPARRRSQMTGATATDVSGNRTKKPDAAQPEISAQSRSDRGRSGRVDVGPSLIVFFVCFVVCMLVLASGGCADGWASPSFGRSGACSHHGGVSRAPFVIAVIASGICALGFHRIRLIWAAPNCGKRVPSNRE